MWSARSLVLSSFTVVGAALLHASSAQAFCGFFVAQADSSLFNQASRVVIAHDQGKTVLTMVSDYRGEPKSFALVVPVPIVLEKELVRVVNMGVVDRVDAFTAPRLAEYFDENPCDQRRFERKLSRSGAVPSAVPEMEAPRKKAADLGVTIEATYTVGEYDIVILSAKQSDGLETYLRQEKYNIPKGASRALQPYIRSGLKFFVARVNLKEHANSGFQSLRPLQFAYPDKRFMLPVRLGLLNADGDQDLIAYVITPKHRVEVANYRTPKIPSDIDVPTFIKQDFKNFYRDMFASQVRKENGRAVFTEYAWDMSWCDPCAADPLSGDELRKLGVWWAAKGQSSGGAQQAFVTRLHARYNAQTFPEDLMLKVTQDSSNFQGRYVMRHPYGGEEWCEAVEPYLAAVKQRRNQEVVNLARLTGWAPNTIWKKMHPLPEPKRPKPKDPEQGWLDQMKGHFQDD